jgi:hypothetical protein
VSWQRSSFVAATGGTTLSRRRNVSPQLSSEQLLDKKWVRNMFIKWGFQIREICLLLLFNIAEDCFNQGSANWLCCFLLFGIIVLYSCAYASIRIDSSHNFKIKGFHVYSLIDNNVEDYVWEWTTTEISAFITAQRFLHTQGLYIHIHFFTYLNGISIKLF